MNEKHAKRLFATAVGAVLVVALAWVGYSLNWIRERHAFLGQQRGTVIAISTDGDRAPHGLWLFGEEAVTDLVASSMDDESAELAKKLFPEADILR